MTPRFGSFEPGWVGAILASRRTGLVARVALVSAYVLGGAVKLANFTAAVAEQAHFGMHPPALWAALTIGVELGGSVLLFTRRWLWLGAGMLGVFTGMAALTANPFWTMEGQARFAATNAFFEHLGLIGGLLAAALLAHRRVQDSRS